MFKYAENLALPLLIVCVFAVPMLGGWLAKRTDAEIAVSCNNLKAAAIAASQPVPECAKK